MLAGSKRFVAGAGQAAKICNNMLLGASMVATCETFRLAEKLGLDLQTFAGFLKHIGEMPDEWRWRMVGNILRAREGFPADTYKRVMAFPSFTMHAGRPWTDARIEDGRICLSTPRGPFMADYVICGTGIQQDVGLRPELAGFADKIALWRHRYTPPPGEEDELLGDKGVEVAAGVSCPASTRLEPPPLSVKK